MAASWVFRAERGLAGAWVEHRYSVSVPHSRLAASFLFFLFGVYWAVIPSAARGKGSKKDWLCLFVRGCWFPLFLLPCVLALSHFVRTDHSLRSLLGHKPPRTGEDVNVLEDSVLHAVSASSTDERYCFSLQQGYAWTLAKVALVALTSVQARHAASPPSA